MQSNCSCKHPISQFILKKISFSQPVLLFMLNNFYLVSVVVLHHHLNHCHIGCFHDEICQPRPQVSDLVSLNKVYREPLLVHYTEQYQSTRTKIHQLKQIRSPVIWRKIYIEKVTLICRDFTVPSLTKKKFILILWFEKLVDFSCRYQGKRNWHSTKNRIV